MYLSRFGCNYGGITMSYEAPKMYDSSVVRTRVKHCCVECDRVIATKEQAEKANALYKDGWRAFYTCSECLQTRNYIRDVLDWDFDEYCFGELYEYLLENNCFFGEEEIESEARELLGIEDGHYVVRGNSSHYAPKVDWLGVRTNGSFCLAEHIKEELKNAA